MDITQSALCGCGSDYENASTVLFGAPFESFVIHRGGAGLAPSAIRKESANIETFSPYLRSDLRDFKIFDAGDLGISGKDVMTALDAVESYCGKIHDDGKMPVMIGGEHILACGAIRAAAARWPDLAVLHFDAHADLKREFRGEAFADYTLMRRVWDIVGDGRIFQFGVRSGSREEFEWAMEHMRVETGNASSIDTCAEAVLSRPIYITVDLDVIDPAELPATGIPEAGGMSFRGLHDALMSLHGLDVVGFDVCELYPPFDVTGASTSLAVKLLREMLIAFS
ncbi:MAG: agmatinase [Synergistaceae bacterium]|jgi:agmatinase|nr:agmatinase [Synergistaceae bacterium]